RLVAVVVAVGRHGRTSLWAVWSLGAVRLCYPMRRSSEGGCPVSSRLLRALLVVSLLSVASCGKEDGKQAPPSGPTDADRATGQREAAEKGDAAAAFDLGGCYLEGKGVEKDQKQAFEWFKRAADKGHVAATSKVGSAYSEGAGVGRDDKKAVEWWTK